MASRRKSNLSLKAKLFTLVALSIVAFSALAFYSSYCLSKMSDTVVYLGKERIPLTATLGDIRAASNAVPRFIWLALAQPSGSPERKKSLEKVELFQKSLSASVREIEKYRLVDQATEHVKQIQLLTPQLEEVATSATSLLLQADKLNSSSNNEKEIKAILMTKMPPVAVKLTEHVVELAKIIEARNTSIVSEAEESSKETSRILFSTSILLGMGLSISGFFFATRLSKDLSLIAKKLGDSSRQVSSASHQVSAASHELASTAAEQASAVEETSASLEEISGMVENNVRFAENGLSVAETVREECNKGEESVQSLTSAMSEVMESNRRIEKLVKVINEIGEKTEIIDEIVFQTKLLSFNASVEAERAGEHGRGFAVVAQEVGNLAQMSGKAALEISSIVNNSIKDAQEIAHENRTKVEKGNEYVHETALALKQIQKQVESVLNGSRQILRASKEQSSGISQINTAMENINKATQETASTSEESASAGEQLNAQAQHLDQLVSTMNIIISGSSEEQDHDDAEDQEDLDDLPNSSRRGNVLPIELNRFAKSRSSRNIKKSSSKTNRKRKEQVDFNNHPHATEEDSSSEDVLPAASDAWEKL